MPCRPFFFAQPKSAPLWGSCLLATDQNLPRQAPARSQCRQEVWLGACLSCLMPCRPFFAQPKSAPLWGSCMQATDLKMPWRAPSCMMPCRLFFEQPKSTLLWGSCMRATDSFGQILARRRRPHAATRSSIPDMDVSHVTSFRYEDSLVMYMAVLNLLLPPCVIMRLHVVSTSQRRYDLPPGRQ